MRRSGIDQLFETMDRAFNDIAGAAGMGSGGPFAAWRPSNVPRLTGGTRGGGGGESDITDLIPTTETMDVGPVASAVSIRPIALDVIEDDKKYQIIAEVPAVPKENLKVSLKNDILTISAENKQEKEQSGQNYWRQERSFGMTERSVRLPQHVENEKLQARFEGGLLKIDLPKSAKHPAKAQSKPIEIK